MSKVHESHYVFFENGSVIDDSEWAWVARRLPDNFMPLTYNRAPFESLPATWKSVSMEAHLLRIRRQWLTTTRNTPAIFVAHSAGALIALACLETHPEMVAGLVLVDPTHPDQFVRSSKQFNSYLWFSQTVGQRAIRSLFSKRLTTLERDSILLLPEEDRSTAALIRSRAATWIHAYRESRSVPRGWADAARIQKKVAVPLVILVSEAAAREDPVYFRLVEELAQISPNSEVEIVAGSNHESIVTDEVYSEHVTNAITRVSAQSRTTSKRIGA